jgi:carboxylesterase type B
MDCQVKSSLTDQTTQPLLHMHYGADIYWFEFNLSNSQDSWKDQLAIHLIELLFLELRLRAAGMVQSVLI